jgi:hypothetical protein
MNPNLSDKKLRNIYGTKLVKKGAFSGVRARGTALEAISLGNEFSPAGRPFDSDRRLQLLPAPQVVPPVSRWAVSRASYYSGARCSVSTRSSGLG